ncbi:MAG: hypothetical protein IJ131_00270 [Eggerthellaceae bacterium]|nr:hypothetical protein [Eggerthellaceae bacterium]
MRQAETNTQEQDTSATGQFGSQEGLFPSSQMIRCGADATTNSHVTSCIAIAL